MKIILIGNARHGKDTVAEVLRDLFGITYQSSSQAASEIFLYDALKHKYGYKTPEECFEDRVNHRKEWHDLIVEYNREDPARLAKEIFKSSDIYVGMRSSRELSACRGAGLVDLVMGVYNPRLPLEDTSSFNIDLWRESDLVIPNAGTLDDLRQKVSDIGRLLFELPDELIKDRQALVAEKMELQDSLWEAVEMAEEIRGKCDHYYNRISEIEKELEELKSKKS